MPEPAQASRCTIVIPCFEEAKRLRRAAFDDFLAVNHSVRFLFVNDGSKDGTLALLQEMQRDHEHAIVILDKTINGGKGEAIRDGMLAAMGPGCDGCDFVGFWDADLATPLNAIEDLLSTLQEDSLLQMVFGSRVRLLGRAIHRKMVRHYAGRIFATIASMTLSIPIYDTQCGAKIFRVTPQLREMLAETFSSKWIFDVELVARFIQLRGRAACFFSIYEYPLKAWEDVAGSKLRSIDFLRAACDLFLIHRRYLADRRT